MNILNFGGGAFVGTAYMLGSLLAFDHALVVPELGCCDRKCFFDYADSANVGFRHLEFRVDEVLAEMPKRVLTGIEDTVSNAFSVAQGISGGSLLAWSVLGGVPLPYLVKSVLEFDARVYLRPNFSEYNKFLKSLPVVISKLVSHSVLSLFNIAGLPFSDSNANTFFFNVFSDLLFCGSHAVKQNFPSSLFCGDGLEDFMTELSVKQEGLSLDFRDFERSKKHLIIIAERLNQVLHIDNGKDLHESEVYFGISPYNDTCVSTAIRASCSIPFLMKPVDWYDKVAREKFQLVDGGVSKTIGFRRINDLYPDAGVWVLFNPIVPHESSVNNIFDMAEQILRKMVYNRKCVVWDRLEDSIKKKTLLFESDPEFRKSLFAWPDMKEALWHGYWHGLEQIKKNYADFFAKLERANLKLVNENLLDLYIDRNNDRKERY